MAAGIDPNKGATKEELVEQMDASDLFALIKTESAIELEKQEKELIRIRVATETAEKMSYGKF